jgi:hypothetical protein
VILYLKPSASTSFIKLFYLILPCFSRDKCVDDKIPFVADEPGQFLFVHAQSLAFD